MKASCRPAGRVATTRWRTVVLVGLLALLLACSDDGSDAEDRDGRPVQDEAAPGDPDDFLGAYQRAADEYADALGEAQERGGAAIGEDPVGATDSYADLAAVTDDAHGRFAQLDPPDAASDAFDGLLDNLDAQLDALDAAVSASQERDDRALQQHLEDYADRLSVWRDRHDELLAQLGST